MPAKTRPALCAAGTFGLLLSLVAASSSHGQVNYWPNDIQMTVDSDNPDVPRVRLRARAKDGEWIVALAYRQTPANVQSLAQAIGEPGVVFVGAEQAGPGGYWDTVFPQSVAPKDWQVGIYGYIPGTGASFKGSFIANPTRFEAPEIQHDGHIDIEVRANPNRVILKHGPGPEDDEVITNFTAGRPMLEAIKRAERGSIIGVWGDFTSNAEGMWLGGAQDQFKQHHIWDVDEPLQFAVVGMNPNRTSRINGFGVHIGVGGSSPFPTAGVWDIVFANLTIEAPLNATHVIGGDGSFGTVRVYSCNFVPHPESTSWPPFYYRWGVRAHAHGSWDLRNCHFAPSEEHCFYVDSPQRDTFLVDNVHEHTGRSMYQVVSRAWELTAPFGLTPEQQTQWYHDRIALYEAGVLQPAEPGRGRLLIDGLQAQRISAGGAVVTLVGFFGDIWVRDADIAYGGPNQATGVLSWTDAGIKHGVHAYRAANGSLYSTRSLTLENININLPQTDREHVAFSGVERVTIHDFTIQGNKPAFAIQRSQDSPNMNDRVMVLHDNSSATSSFSVMRMPHDDDFGVNLIGNDFTDAEFLVPDDVASYPGFQSAVKVRGWSNATILTDSQINNIWNDGE